MTVEVAGQTFKDIGNRVVDVWDGEPEGVYVPTDTAARFNCRSEATEVFVAGARFDKSWSRSRFGQTNSMSFNMVRMNEDPPQDQAYLWNEI